MKLKDKVALVTGTSPNIGGGLAEALAAEGAAVVSVDASAANANDCAAYIKSIGGKALGITCDVTDEAQVTAAVQKACETFGQIDVLVNNAVFFNKKGVLTMPLAEWRKQIDVILTGAFLFTKYVAQSMIDRQVRGSILNIVSTAGHQGEPNNIAYSTAKSGMLNFTRSAAMELAKHGIRVNSLTPTATDPSESSERRNAGAAPRSISRRPGRSSRCTAAASRCRAAQPQRLRPRRRLHRLVRGGDDDRHRPAHRCRRGGPLLAVGPGAEVTLPPKVKLRAFEEICERIRRQLAAGKLKPGDKLPPERELSEQLGVSRAALREALRTLEIAGVIMLKKGVKGGAFVQAGDPANMTRVIQDLVHLGAISLGDLTEARLLIQSGVVRLACERATDADIEAIGRHRAHRGDVAARPCRGATCRDRRVLPPAGARHAQRDPQDPGRFARPISWSASCAASRGAPSCPA